MKKVIQFKPKNDTKESLVKAAKEMEVCSKVLHGMSRELEERIAEGLSDTDATMIDVWLRQTLAQSHSLMEGAISMGCILNNFRALLVDEDFE